MPEASLTIRVFGPLQVWLQGELLPHLRTRKVAWTLALLVLRHGRAVERDWLAGTLWPDSEAERAHYNLRRSLSEIRRALGSEARRITSPSPRAVALDLSGADVDLLRFDEALRRDDAASLTQAVAVYAGPLLEGCTEAWVLPERDAREQAYLQALERLASSSLTASDAASAVAHLRRAVAVDPFRESAHRLLLEALAAGGEYGEAVQTYRALRLLLWDELRTEPSPETRAVYEQIREQAAREAAPAPERMREARPPGVPPAHALPQVWNVPHRRNPHFTGREDMLAGLEATLAADGHAAPTQAVVGLGGIGKTQLALEYAYRHVDDYHIIWWIRSEEPAQLAADYADLAKALELPEKTVADQIAVVVATRRWLERHGGWLLIFDNTPGPQEVAGYLPRGGGGQVLLTSRNQDWGDVAAAVSVPVLSPEEAVALLEKRTGWSGPEVATLAEELGHLPLALEQCAAYAAASGCSPGAYLELFRSRRQALLQRGGPPGGYQGTVAGTWSISIAQAAAECPAATGLLSLCAYLAPDHIPLSLIQRGAKSYPEPLAEAARDPLLLREAVAALRRYSLVTVHQDALSVHRLVQAVVRDGLSEEEQCQWATGAAWSLLEQFPGHDTGRIPNSHEWPLIALLLPHMLAAVELVAPFHTTTDTVLAGAYLLASIGKAATVRGEYDLARTCFAREMAHLEQWIGEEDEDYIWTLELYSSFVDDPGPVRERMVALAKKVWGPEHEYIPHMYWSLASARCKEGDDAGAAALMAEGIRLMERYTGPEPDGLQAPRPVLIAARRAALAYLLVRLGDLPKARAEAEQAKAVYDQAPIVRGGPQPGPPSPAPGHVILAYVMGQEGDFAGERDHLQAALEIYEQVVGAEHDRPMMVRGRIGLFSKPAFGDLTGARDDLARVLAYYEKMLGREHPFSVGIAIGLAETHRWLGDPAAARCLAERAVAIAEAAERRTGQRGFIGLRGIYGVDFDAAIGTRLPSLRAALVLLADILLDAGDLEAAQSHLERALTMERVTYGELCGPDTEGVAEVLPTLARLRRLQGRLEEAKAALEQSLTTPEHPGPPHPWRMAATHLEHGLALKGMGDLAGAREHLTQAVSAFARRLGPRHPRTEEARGRLAEIDAGRGSSIVTER